MHAFKAEIDFDTDAQVWVSTVEDPPITTEATNDCRAMLAQSHDRRTAKPPAGRGDPGLAIRRNEEVTIEAYLEVARETGEPEFIADAEKVVERAKRM
jgi:hypothetical protein